MTSAHPPLRLLSPRGAWEECIVVNRATGCNQYVVRVPPMGHLHWTLLLSPGVLL